MRLRCPVPESFSVVLAAVAALLTASSVQAAGAMAVPPDTAAAPAAMAPAWAATRTRAHTPAYEVAVDNGTLPDRESIPIAVTLQLRDVAALNALTDRVVVAGKAAPALTSRQFLDRHAPTVAQAERVATYLRANGFQNVAIAANRMQVTGDGTPTRIRAAFQADLHAFDVGGRRAFANVTDARVPASLADSVLAVVGLQTVQLAHTNTRRAPVVLRGSGATRAENSSTASIAGIDPTQFARIYGADGMPSAEAATIGVITQGSMAQTLVDLRTAAANAGYPAPSVTVVTVGAASNDTAGVDEWNLDTQTALAAAGGTVRGIVLYAARTLSDASLTVTYNRAVSDNLARVINVSLGECETSADISGVRASNDQIFQAAVAQGQTFAVASGDSGAYGCGGSGTAQSYPATSPYVMAIGGTTLATSGGNWAGETAWSCSGPDTCPQSAAAGTGGGASRTEAAPSWQTAAGVLSTAGRRGVPDISFDAAPESGALILVNGNYYQIGGTSLSAPLFTGFYSRIQSAHGNSLGFPAASLYAGAAANPAWFHDVTSGGNGAYAAGVGWDYVTGFGSLQVQNFSASLANGTAPGSTLTVDFGCTASGLTISCVDSSTDVGGTILGNAWTFGDGGSASGTQTSHSYAAAGSYTVTETVTETGTGNTATRSAPVSVTVPAPSATWTPIASEGQAFSVSGTQTVRYGSGSSWISRTVTDSGTCSNDFFGSDPLYGVVKQCQLASASPAPTTWTKIATENEAFAVTGTRVLRYGSGVAWVTMSVTSGGICSNAFFGSDPAFGIVKECDVGS